MAFSRSKHWVLVWKQVGLLMDEVHTKIENTDNKREWYNKFVAIFSLHAAYEDLVQKLKRSVGDTGNCPHVATKMPVNQFLS